MPDRVLLTRMQRLKVITDAIAKLLIAFIILFLVATLAVIAYRQQESIARGKQANKTTVKQLDKGNEILNILKCYTIPGQPCFNATKKGQDDLVQTINQVSILASSCASILPHPTPEAVKNCVTKGLK